MNGSWDSDPFVPLYRAIAAERPDRVTQEARKLLQAYSAALTDLRWQHKILERLVEIAKEDCNEA